MERKEVIYLVSEVVKLLREVDAGLESMRRELAELSHKLHEASASLLLNCAEKLGEGG